jgi:hypothetical protein
MNNNNNKNFKSNIIKKISLYDENENNIENNIIDSIKDNENKIEHLNNNTNILDEKFHSVRITCNCKKSKCLKLYCECFSSGNICTKDCNCIDCINLENFDDEIKIAKISIKEKNPNAFLPKINEEISKHLKGCKCKNSKCKKNYCECFQNGISCSNICKCENCANGKINE